ncbi:MAG: hypothetical protein ACK4VO_00305 [Pseudobdellovibrio sp.]
MKYNLIAILTAFLFISSCASTAKHDHTRGNIVALDTDNTAHVCMSSKTVKLGDELEAFKVTCKKNKVTTVKAKELSEPTVCEKTLVGKVVVTELIDDHFIKIRPNAGLSLSEGLVVEKN